MNNKKYNKALLAFSAGIALSACSTVSLSKEQCLSRNWHAIGYSDGVLGHYPNRIADHQQACAETGVIPNPQAWEKGRKEGLVNYCTEANAKRLGEAGQGLNAVCPSKRVNRLQTIHNKAYKYYKVKQAIHRDTKKLERYRSELSKLRSGEMLHFKTEVEAREYMLRIQKEVLVLEKRIQKNQKFNGSH